MSESHRTPSPENLWTSRVKNIAAKLCVQMLGTAEGQRATMRIAMAFLGARAAARRPEAFDACTDTSIATAIMLSVQTRLYPGGPHAPVYLVPQAPRKGEAPALQWRINHRGIAVLAHRAGFAIRSIPVASADFLRVSLGEVVEHTVDLASAPESLEDIQGIAVIVRDLDRGADVCRAFVARALVERRREKSRDHDGPWTEWPVEMAQGAAIRYLMARGAIPIDSPELALALDAEMPIAAERDVPTSESGARSGSGMAAIAKALEDRGEPEDLRAQVDALGERETVPVESAPPADVTMGSALPRDPPPAPRRERNRRASAPPPAPTPTPPAAPAAPPASDEVGRILRLARSAEDALVGDGGSAYLRDTRRALGLPDEPTWDATQWVGATLTQARSYRDALTAGGAPPTETAPDERQTTIDRERQSAEDV